MGDGACDAVLFSRNVQDTDLELFGDHDINAVGQQRVEFGLTSKRIENVNCVHAVGVDDNSGTVGHGHLQIVACTCDCLSFKVENDVVGHVLWDGGIVTSQTVRVTESHAFHANITENCCVSIFNIPCHGGQKPNPQ